MTTTYKAKQNEVLDIDWNEYFEYDPSSPTFLINKTTRSPKALAGLPAGCVGAKEIKVRFNIKYYRNARIIWEMHNGPIPEGMFIQFKDKNEFNLLLDNLSLQTRRERGLRKISSLNPSGERGVYIYGNTFRVQLKYKGEPVYLGSFKSKEEAVAARDRALKLTK